MRRLRYFVARRYGDSIHEVFEAGLRGGAELHRFRNSGGERYSAVYVRGEEIWSCERGSEGDMLEMWNAVKIGKIVD